MSGDERVLATALVERHRREHDLQPPLSWEHVPRKQAQERVGKEVDVEELCKEEGQRRWRDDGEQDPIESQDEADLINRSRIAHGPIPINGVAAWFPFLLPIPVSLRPFCPTNHLPPQASSPFIHGRHQFRPAEAPCARPSVCRPLLPNVDNPASPPDIPSSTAAQPPPDACES